jgi:hypothetical protein
MGGGERWGLGRLPPGVFFWHGTVEAVDGMVVPVAARDEVCEGL